MTLYHFSEQTRRRQSLRRWHTSLVAVAIVACLGLLSWGLTTLVSPPTLMEFPYPTFGDVDGQAPDLDDAAADHRSIVE